MKTMLIFIFLYSAIMTVLAFTGVYKSVAGVDRVVVGWVHCGLVVLSLVALLCFPSGRSKPPNNPSSK